jgi:hypothetical protein
MDTSLHPALCHANAACCSNGKADVSAGQMQYGSCCVNALHKAAVIDRLTDVPTPLLLWHADMYLHTRRLWLPPETLSHQMLFQLDFVWPILPDCPAGTFSISGVTSHR